MSDTPEFKEACGQAWGQPPLPTFEGVGFTVREISPWHMAYPSEDETPLEFMLRKESLQGKVQFMVRMKQEVDGELFHSSVMSPFGEESQRRELVVKAFEAAGHSVYNEMMRKSNCGETSNDFPKAVLPEGYDFDTDKPTRP